ncbi:MAG: hypothetical protein R3C05_17345 [Pirellulaceae bacterium]
MAIQFQCQCGKELKLKDEFAGKKIRCPSCQQPLQVPAVDDLAADLPPVQQFAQPTPAAAGHPGAGGLGALFDEEGMGPLSGPVCMGCAKEMRPGTVICMNCGFNMQTGQRLQGFTESQAAASRYGNAALDEAAAHMQRDAEVQRQISGTGLPVWVLATILMCLGGLAVMGVFVSNTFAAEEGADTGSPVPRYILIGILLFLQACGMYFWIRLTIAGFNEEPKHGFLCLFTIVYAPFYGMMRKPLRSYGVSMLVVAFMSAIIYFGGFALLSVLKLA